MQMILLEKKTRDKFLILNLEGEEQIRELKKKLKVKKKEKAKVSKKKQNELKLASFLNQTHNLRDEVEKDTIT